MNTVFNNSLRMYVDEGDPHIHKNWAAVNFNDSTVNDTEQFWKF